MTPTATTPAARRKQVKDSKRPGTPGTRSAGHRASVRTPAAPSAPRRVSGPLGGLTRGGTVAAPARPATRPQRRPRPATRPQPRPRTRPAKGGQVRAPLAARALAYVRALPDHALLDRVVRGRAWIPLLGVLLAGIVAMQVEVLKLGAGMGRAIEQGTALQSRNELLRSSVASLSDDQRIESRAAAMGMVMPAPDAVNFLSLRATGAVQRAVANIHAPNGSGFLATLAASTSPTTGG